MVDHQVDKATEELEKKKADFKAGKSLVVRLFIFCVSVVSCCVKRRLEFMTVK